MLTPYLVWKRRYGGTSLKEMKMINAIRERESNTNRFAIQETTLRELSPTEVDSVAGANSPYPWTTISVTVTVTESSAVCTTITVTL